MMDRKPLDQMSRRELIDHAERIQQRLRAATDEVIRLRGVIRDHTASSARYVVANIEADVVSVIDVDGLKTRVTTRPKQHEFYLAEPLGGWSDDHRHEFYKHVVRAFSERAADEIGRSIWNATTK